MTATELDAIIDAVALVVNEQTDRLLQRMDRLERRLSDLEGHASSDIEADLRAALEV